MSGWQAAWSTWSTYTLADLLMFSPRTYYRLFELYNNEVWPGQLVTAVAGLTILACALRPNATRARLAAGLLAAGWLWVAWAFLAKRYASINWAAEYFAYGFAIEALLLLWFGTLRGRLPFPASRDFANRAGLGIFAFGLLVYPLLAAAYGRPWRQSEMLGLAPDPTAIATLGLLLMIKRTPAPLLCIPLLWCVITGATLITMRAPDAWIAPAIAVLTLLAMAWRLRLSGQGDR
jgi:hypothetical protein